MKNINNEIVTDKDVKAFQNMLKDAADIKIKYNPKWDDELTANPYFNAFSDEMQLLILVSMTLNMDAKRDYEVHTKINGIFEQVRKQT